MRSYPFLLPELSVGSSVPSVPFWSFSCGAGCVCVCVLRRTGDLSHPPPGRRVSWVLSQGAEPRGTARTWPPAAREQCHPRQMGHLGTLASSWVTERKIEVIGRAVWIQKNLFCLEWACGCSPQIYRHLLVLAARWLDLARGRVVDAVSLNKYDLNRDFTGCPFGWKVTINLGV